MSVKVVLVFFEYHMMASCVDVLNSFVFQQVEVERIDMGNSEAVGMFKLLCS